MATWRQGIDYSTEIEKAKKAGKDTTQLEAERAAKIKDVYGGKEPTMTGSTKTYSELSSSGGSSSKREIDNAILSTPGGSVSYTTAAGEQGLLSNSGKGYNTNLDGVLGDVDKMVAQLEKEGYIKNNQIVDWEAVNEMLTQSELKAKYEGSSFDKTAVGNAILAKYGSAGSGTTKKQAATVSKNLSGNSGGELSYSAALKQSGGGSAGGSGSGASGGVDGLISELQGLYGENGSYAEALKQQQAANQAGVDKAVNALESQKKDTDQNYANLFKQLYLNKMAAKKNIGQQMAAQGVTGGAAESTMLGLDTSYQEALRQGEEGRIAAVGELDQAISDAQLTGDITDAQLAADNAKERTASYAAVLQNLINRYDALAANQTSREDALAAIEREQAANAKAYAYQTAMQLLQNGNMASDELLSAAGINKADAAAMVSAVEAAKKQVSSVGGSYSSKPTSAQAEVALNAALNGDRSSAVVAAVEGYYGMPLDTVLSAYGVNGREEKIAAAAAAFNAQHPAQEVDGWVVNTYLTNAGYTGEDAELFKAYLRQYRG